MGERFSELKEQQTQSDSSWSSKRKGKAPPHVTTEGESANTCRSDARREVDEHECHPAEGYNRRSSSTSSKHWADRDNEVMDFKAGFDWEYDDEATGSKGVTLFKVTEKTEKFLTVVFSSGVPNTARCQWRVKYGASNTKATSCPNLDKVMKSRLPAVTKSRDRQLVKQQALMLDAVGSITYILE